MPGLRGLELAGVVAAAGGGLTFMAAGLTKVWLMNIRPNYQVIDGVAYCCSQPGLNIFNWIMSIGIGVGILGAVVANIKRFIKNR